MKTRLLNSLALCLLLATHLSAAGPELTEAIAERYEQMLVRSPQPGTSFDKVIEWYSGPGGGLDNLRSRWQDAAASSPSDSGRYLILQALLAERQRDPASARKLYTAALDAPGDPAVAAKLLAALETTEGRFAEAASAYRKALESDSLPPLVRMDILRALALLYQRSFDHERAAGVWKEAVTAFPDDPFILEEAGEAALAAGDHTRARECFEKLAVLSSQDPFRKVSATLRVARAAEMAGDSAGAVAIYERSLEETSPGSWIHRDVRNRIEELFRRKDDLPGLLSYYERRTTAIPADYESLAAMAAVLDDLRRGPEALEKLRAAAALAPSSTELKVRLIEKLEAAGHTEEVIQTAREMATPSNATPESLTLLGDLLWKQQKNRPESREEAISTFQRIAPPGSTDPGLIARLAEIFAAKEEMELAAAQWTRLTEVAPPAADARQKLAQLAMDLGDKDAAHRWLDGITSGIHSTPENFLTRARIEAKLDLTDEARKTLTTALEKFPENPDVLAFAWRGAMEDKDASLAARLFVPVFSTAPNEFFAEDAVKRYAAFLESAGSAKARMEELTRAAQKHPLPAPEALLLLQLAINSDDEAAAKSALSGISSPPVRGARANVRFAQAFGSATDQITAFRAVADADPRFAAESLKSAATLLALDGQIDEAVSMIGDLITRSPADGSLYLLSADLLSRAGKMDEALGRLEEGIRYAGEPAPLRLQLASLLQTQSRFEEASQVLTEAFESETSEPKRADIFRRQVELAMLSGTIDSLIENLKDRQRREEGGARYGAYLAEIFLEQGDLLAAKEELEKSLGRNPDSIPSVSKLLDLADRGGDEDEALRLARRLVELDPSVSNRSSLIVRLFNSQQPEQALEAFLAAKPEILADPAAWSEALLALRSAGFSEQFHSVVDELSADPGASPVLLLEIATLYLASLDYDKATAILWEIVENPEFGPAVESISRPPASLNPGFAAYMGMGTSHLRLQALQQAAMKAREKLQSAVTQNSGFHRRSFMGFRIPGLAGPAATPEESARVQAFFALLQIAEAREQSDAFKERASRAADASPMGRDEQFLLALASGNEKRANALIQEQAADPAAQPADDLTFLINLYGRPVTPSPELDTIRARVDRQDPKTGFQLAMTQLFMDARVVGSPDSSDLAARIRTLLTHPGATSHPALKLQLVHLAIASGDPTLTRELIQSAKSSLENSQLTPQETAALQSQMLQTEGFLLGRSIQNGDDVSGDDLVALLADPKKLSPMSYVYTGSGMRRYVQPSQLLNPSQELTVGDSGFPFAIFRQFFPISPSSKEFEKVTKWFSSRAQPGQLDPFSVGMAYCDWLGGKKDAALERINTIHSINPSPRTAALLAEMYEKSDDPAKALGFLETAEFLPDETQEVRSLRKIRLLRSANRIDEAKELASKLAKSRTSMHVRSALQSELSQLGIPDQQFPNVAFSRVHRRTPDRSDIFRDQVQKLTEAGKKTEAAALIIRALDGPLPGPQDYNTRNIRSYAFSAAKDLDTLKPYMDSLEARLAANPADFDAAVRLMECQARESNKPSPDRLISMVETYPDQATHLDQALIILDENDSESDSAARLMSAMIKKDVRLLHTSGNAMERLGNIATNSKNGLLLAETMAGLDDATFLELYTPTRLARQDFQSPILGQLAEHCVLAGNKQAAIKLLTRSLATAGSDPGSRLMASLRLAELQLETGDAEAARTTMQELFRPASVPNFEMFGGGRSTISTTLMNMLQNPNPGGGRENRFEKITQIANATGTMPDLIAAIDKDPGLGFGPMGRLTLKTLLGETGQADEWRAALKEKPKQGHFFGAHMVAPVIAILAKEKDAATLIPALLEAIPPQSYQYGGHTGLTMLAETLPALSRLRKHPAVEQHIEMVLDGVMRDPNAAQYLAHQDGYWEALDALVADARYADARRLIDFTSASQQNIHSGWETRSSAIRARLDLAEGRPIPITVDCAVAPDGTIHWQISPAPPPGKNLREQRQAVWDSSTVEIPKKLRPSKIEFFAGPNPAALTPVGTTAKPGVSGQTSVKLPPPFGLVQARWTLPDGSSASGRLVAYVLGENLITHRGLPSASDQLPANFLDKLPGPLGSASAVGFNGLIPQQKLEIDLASVELGSGPAILALTGWFRGTSRHGQIPAVQISWLRKNGKTGNEGTYSNNPAPGQWVQVIRFWSRETDFRGASSLAAHVQKLSARLELRANSGYNNLWQIQSEWDGLGLYRLEPPAGTSSVSKLLDQARKDHSDGRTDAACSAYLEALLLSPRDVLSQSAFDFFNGFSKAGRLPDLYKALSNPALYLPDPLRNGEPSFENNQLLELLVAAAVKEGAPKEASRWLKTVRSAPMEERSRFLVEAAVFRGESLGDPAKVDPAAVLGVLGFSADTVSADRVQSLFANPSSPVFSLLTLLDSPDSRSQARKLLSSWTVPPEYHSARLALDAFLAAPDEPAEALKSWLSTLALRRSGNNSVSFYQESDLGILSRIAVSHPVPGDIIGAVSAWATQNTSDPGHQNRLRMDMLDQITSSSPSTDPAYAGAWADLVIAALRQPQLNLRTERLTELGNRLLHAGQMERLEALTGLVTNHRSLTSGGIQRDFARLRMALLMGRGELDNARPVIWAAPAGPDGHTTVFWQWGPSSADAANGRFDSELSLTDRRLVPTIPSQSKISILFGETPWEMQEVSSISGNASSGKTNLQMPSSNGFLRAVAHVDDREFAGPLSPVFTGRRIFPADGESLRDMLTSGSRPLSPQQLSDEGTAPDGQSAIQIGQPDSSQRLAFLGADYPVSPGKLYATRLWSRRVRDSGGVISAEWLASSKSRDLLWELSPQAPGTGGWMFSTRAFLARPLPSSSFPMQDLSDVRPKIHELSAGGRIAGWEMLEIGDWKYATWIFALDEAVKNARSRDQLAEAIRPGLSEPLTAIDLYGDSLVKSAGETNSTADLLPLFRSAMATSSPNPFFPKPKIGRHVNLLIGISKNESLPMDTRVEALAILTDHLPRVPESLIIPLWDASLSLAGDSDTSTATRARISSDLINRLSQAGPADTFARNAFSSVTYSDDLPTIPLITLIGNLKDPTTIQAAIEFLSSKNIAESNPARAALLTIALQALAPGALPDAQWKSRVEEAFSKVSKNHSTVATYHAAAYLAEVLTAKNAPADLLLPLHTQILDLLIEKAPTGRHDEILMALLSITRFAASSDTKPDLNPLLSRATTHLDSLERKPSSNTKRIAGKLVPALETAGYPEAAGAVKSLSQ